MVFEFDFVVFRLRNGFFFEEFLHAIEHLFRHIDLCSRRIDLIGECFLFLGSCPFFGERELCFGGIDRRRRLEEFGIEFVDLELDEEIARLDVLPLLDMYCRHAPRNLTRYVDFCRIDKPCNLQRRRTSVRRRQLLKSIFATAKPKRHETGEEQRSKSV